MFQAVSTDGRDYHTEINGNVFRDWMESTLLPILNRPSCIVMDNASYHNVVAPEDKIPTTSSTKDAIRTWLRNENVNFDYLKPELLQLVKQTNKDKVYCVDKIIESYDYVSLRLPAYHLHLNPIELVWAKIKGQVAAQNTTFKMYDVKVLTHNALMKIDIEFRKRCLDHVLREEEEYWQPDGLQFIQPPTVVNLIESSDTDRNKSK
jgi:transposase